MQTISFSLVKVYEGLAKTEGLLRYEDDTVWRDLITQVCGMNKRIKPDIGC